MALTEPSLPLEVRYRAAQQAAKTAIDAEEALALLTAAVEPSETVYWVKAA